MTVRRNIGLRDLKEFDSLFQKPLLHRSNSNTRNSPDRLKSRMSVVWADAPGTLQEFHRDLKGRVAVAPPCRCPPAGPLNFKGFQETAAPACRQRANIPLSRYAIRNQRYLRPGTSPRLEISRQILSFVSFGEEETRPGENRLLEN